MNIPLTTYRLQFNAGFTFRDALSIVDYLSRLGVSCIYASPIFRARKGSTHGYDIIDPREINPEIGSVADFEELSAAARGSGLLWLQDIVPNHMAYSGENKLIIDLLENGRRSRYFNYFDINWQYPYEGMRSRLLAPFLGKFYGESLENGEIKLAYDTDGFHLCYYDVRLPLRIESYIKVLTFQLSSLKHNLGAEHPDLVRLLGVLYTLKNLPPHEDCRELYSHINFIKKALWDLYSGNRHIREYVDNTIEIFNGRRGDPNSFNMLEILHTEQFFRLSFWKVAAEEVNYRRFFNINELISLRVEDEEVFSFTHEFIFRSLDENMFCGVRVDHIDGLYDPAQYLRRLRDRTPEACVYVEKVLGFGEELPVTWPVQGTTGYDFLNYVNGLFCDTKNEEAFTRMYDRFIGFAMNYRNLVFDKKRLIIGKYMAGDIDALAQLMKGISNRYRYASDITIYGLKRALVDVLALFPIYRTYISHERYSDTDRIVISRVVDKAKQENPGLMHELTFIEDFLLLNFKDYFSEDDKRQWINFVMRFQQYTGPLMAKGVEDTVLYVYNRLISLNDVGGNPGKFGVNIAEFHRFNERRARHWPHTLNATATHDTKRGEDARARINVLSEIPGRWRRNVKLWSMLNRPKKKPAGEREMPDRNDEYQLYQTLVGTFPFHESEYTAYIQRIKTYAIKAVREAKINTAWLKPDEEYEEAFISFIDSILSPDGDNKFLRSFLPFQKMVADYAIVNSLSQTLLKAAAPGTPDFYQGSEMWDLSLVDPDNRRQIDFAARDAFLNDIIARDNLDRAALIDDLFEHREDGRIKLFLIYRLLQARRRHRNIFTLGSYVPLSVTGKKLDNVIAFARYSGKAWAIAAAIRFPVKLMKSGRYVAGHAAWADTSILLPADAPPIWSDAVTGAAISASGTLPVAELFREFPVTLLISDAPSKEIDKG